MENVFSLALFFPLLSYLLCEMGKYFFSSTYNTYIYSCDWRTDCGLPWDWRFGS